MKIITSNIFLVFAFTFCFTGILLGQSKFEYGIGVGINHSQINQEISTIVGPGFPNEKGLRLPAVMTRIAYKINDEFHLNTGPGISWIGSLDKDLEYRTVATTVEIPLAIEWNPWKHMQVSTGPVYNYIAGMTIESDQQNIDMLFLVESRHQVGLRHGISFSYEDVELFANYSHYLTDVFNVRLTDVTGSIVGTSQSKFKNIQIGVIFRR